MIENYKIFNEEWIPWEPIQGLEKFSSLISVVNDFEGLKIVVTEYKNPKKRVLINFDGYVASYRDTDESYRLKLMHDLKNKYPEWSSMGRFFKIDNSHYLQWLSEQSYGISDLSKFMHFVIVSNDVFFDIIAGFEPKVNFLDDNGNPIGLEEAVVIWEPIEGLVGKYGLESIVDAACFEVALCAVNKQNMVKICFDKSVDAYYKLSASLSTGMVVNTNGRYGIGFFKNKTFFKVTNSSYIQWLDKFSSTFDVARANHFVLLLDDGSSLNMIASYEPTVELIKVGKNLP